MQPLASALTLEVLTASADAVAKHYLDLFGQCQGTEDELALVARLEAGDVRDLDDHSDDHHVLGFRHRQVSRIFYRRLRSLHIADRRSGRFPRGIDRHIWRADYDRKIRSLFPTGPGSVAAEEELFDDFSADSDYEAPPKTSVERTRASAIVQQSLLRNRRVIQVVKAGTSRQNEHSLFLPSPYYVASRILTDPEHPYSEVYALAALRMDIGQRVLKHFSSLDLNYNSISRALETIAGRFTTSKPLLSGGGETIFLCHYLAMLGMIAIEIPYSPKGRHLSLSATYRNVDNLFEPRRSRHGSGDELPAIGFRLHPDQAELPDAGELLNALAGLPLPVEGASNIFHGGLRFSTGGDIVAAVSGPFGAGKTSACLSLAASLAPLGCRTLFLSCEEAADDIEARLAESTPEFVGRSTPLVACVSLEEMRRSGAKSDWFRAHALRVNGPAASPDKAKTSSDVARELKFWIDEAIERSLIFWPFKDEAERGLRPSFARPIIIIDGFHQLFRETNAPRETIETSLRELIDYCRSKSAITIFTAAEQDSGGQRLDYLCDLVFQLDRDGFDQPDEAAVRIFRLLKARRQPAIPGSHIFHLAGPRSFRIKPSVSARAELARRRKWVEPQPNVRIQIADDWPQMRVQNRSQMLIYGRGPAGKAGLAMSILHRRPIEAVARFRETQTLFPTPRSVNLPLPDHESRTLVISFLYPAQYYRAIHRRLRHAKRGESARHLTWLPDRSLFPDVVSLYPGSLRPEDFLAKVENAMDSAELRGLPYTGVLVDGIHNVFVQYPMLEADTSFWAQLYGMLRRRGVNVVTTHTEFELGGGGETGGGPFGVDFEHAQRKAAPLLSVLISGADYVFELVSDTVAGVRRHQLYARSALGEDPTPDPVIWDRQRARLGERQLSLQG